MEISEATKDGLVDSIIQSLKKVSDNKFNSEFLVLLIRAFTHLKPGMLKERLKPRELNGVDVFTPILNTECQENGLCFVAVLLAFFSVNEELHTLIIDTIDDWYVMLPPKSSENMEFQVGFYTIVSQLEKSESVEETLERLSRYDVGNVLVSLWVPHWLSYVSERGCNSSAISILELSSSLFSEDILDFYLATTNSITLRKFGESSESAQRPTAFAYKKLFQRAILFPEWTDKHLYQTMLNQLLSYGDQSRDELSFSLKILMEIVDHSDMNYLEEPNLVISLFLSLKKIHHTPCNVLHTELGILGSTQSLPAILNIIQYLLSRFLINAGNVCELAGKINLDLQLTHEKKNDSWYRSKNNTIKLPDWFEKAIVPCIPPISKSLLVSGECDWRDKEGSALARTIDLLIDCLEITLLINGNILSQYHDMGINPLAFNEFGTEWNVTLAKVECEVKKEFMQLYLIPLFSSLMLAKLLNGNNTEIYHEKKHHMKGEIIFSNSLAVCKKLIHAHNSLALHNVISFITKISIEDLFLQSISVEILYHLMFTDGGNYIKDLIVENPLTQEALRTYFSFWGDGSKKYEPFREYLLTKQAESQTNVVTLSNLIELLPNHEVIFQKMAQNTKVTYESKGFTAKRSSLLGQGKKFNPYSATPFVPATKARNMQADGLPTLVEQQLEEGSKIIGQSSWEMFDGKSGGILSEREQHTAANNCFGGNLSFIDQNAANLNVNGIPSIISAPQTPNMSTSTMLSSLWDNSPSIHSTPNMSRMVNTGKNYILGGHNRVKNNSRAQSIHIDNFEQN